MNVQENKCCLCDEYEEIKGPFSTLEYDGKYYCRKCYSENFKKNDAKYRFKRKGEVWINAAVLIKTPAHSITDAKTSLKNIFCNAGIQYFVINHADFQDDLFVPSNLELTESLPLSYYTRSHLLFNKDKFFDEAVVKFAEFLDFLPSQFASLENEEEDPGYFDKIFFKLPNGRRLVIDVIANSEMNDDMFMDDLDQSR